MRKLIDFFRDVKDQKRGANEFEEMKPQLTQDEIELIETVFQLMADIAHWSAEQTLIGAGILSEERDGKNVKAMIKAFDIFSKFAINPMLVVRYLRSLDIKLSKEILMQMLDSMGGSEEEPKDDNPTQDGETLEDIQQELANLLNKFNQN